MKEDLRELEECVGKITQIMDAYEMNGYDMRDALSDLAADISYHIYIANGWKYCSVCEEFKPKEQVSKWFVFAEEDTCVCVNCEQTAIDDLK